MSGRILHGLATLTAVLLGAFASSDARSAGPIVVIAHPNVTAVDPPTVEKIFTGRVVEVNGVSVTAVNASSGSAIRNRFLQTYLNEDEEKYTAYWVVRRYVGKGAPPRELSSGGAIVNFVRNTPGAIGFVEESEVEPGVIVLLR